MKKIQHLVYPSLRPISVEVLIGVWTVIQTVPIGATQLNLVNAQGRYVRIQIKGYGQILSFAEVKVLKLNDTIAPHRRNE